MNTKICNSSLKPAAGDSSAAAAAVVAESIVEDQVTEVRSDGCGGGEYL